MEVNGALVTGNANTPITCEKSVAINVLINILGIINVTTTESFQIFK